MDHEYKMVWRFKEGEFVQFHLADDAIIPLVARVIAVNNPADKAHNYLYPVVRPMYTVVILTKDGVLTNPTYIGKIKLEAGRSLGFDRKEVELLYL